MAAIQVSNFKDVYNGTGVQLSSIKKAFGKDYALKVIQYLLTNLALNINVGKQMREEQIKEGASMLYDEYWSLTLDDFKLCFKMAIMGKFGVTYDRLDIQIISDWLNRYSIDRNEAIFAMERTKENETRNTVIKTKGHTPETRIINTKPLKELMPDIFKPEPENKTPYVKREDSDLDIRVKALIAEFDEIAIKTNLPDSGMRFIKYKDKIVDLNEYLTIKTKETNEKKYGL